MNYSCLWILVAVLCAGLHPGAQASESHSLPPKPREVPFQVREGRVLVAASVNGSRLLTLTLDTGMAFDGVYLFHQEMAAGMDTAGAMEVLVPGAGAGNASNAIMLQTGHLSFGEVQIDSQRVIISRSPVTQSFENDGVVGWNFFGHYTVELDYDRGLMRLHDPAGFRPDTTWQEIPITLKKGIPFLAGTVEVVSGESVPMTLYIDLASDRVLELLEKPGQKFTLPADLKEQYLGTGLSGDIYGRVGRSCRLQVASFALSDVPTAFAPAEVRSKQEGADGVLGGSAIRRFNIIFDYTRNRLLLKPNRAFAAPFE